MANASSFEKKLGRISARDWGEVRGAWLAFLPVIDEPGMTPEHALAELDELWRIAEMTPETGEHRGNVPGAREALFRESLFVLHKAVHVTGCAEMTATTGMPSWALSIAYQGAYFAHLAILHLLGIAILERNNRTILVDVWPEIVSGASRREQRQYQLGADAQFVSMPRLDHFHRWAILQRVMRVMRGSPLHVDLQHAIDRRDERSFARQRNRLHYSTSWLFDDLWQFRVLPDFGSPATSERIAEILSEKDEDFSLVLAEVLVAFAVRLLTDVAAFAPALQPEVDLLVSSLVAERHPLYGVVARLI